MNGKKKTIVTITGVIVAIAICSGAFLGGFFAGKTAGGMRKGNDKVQEEFLSAMARGIEKRCSDDEDSESMTDKEKSDYYLKLVDLELEEIGEYEKVRFEDELFDTLVHTYFDALKAQRTAAENYKHETLYTGLWNGGRKIRCGIIIELYENYGLDLEDEEINEYKSEFEPSYTYSFTSDDSDEKDDFDAEKTAEQIKVVKQYTYSRYRGVGITYVLENQSEYDLEVEMQLLVYDKNGKVIDTESDSEYCIGAGCQYPMTFNLDEEPEKYDYRITVGTTNWKSGTKKLSCDSNISGKNAIVSVKNDSKETMEFVQVFVLFMKDGKLVDCEEKYATDVDSEIKAGKTEVVKVTTSNDFDDVKVYATGYVK